MKKTILLAAAVATILGFASCGQKKTSDNQQTAAIDATHNSHNSLDWQGTYTGITPCADCEGINVSITLNLDETYQASYSYMGKNDAKPELFSGKFTWNKEGNTITLENSEIPPHYKVGENKLFQLDMEGNPISDTQFPEAYVLTKTLNSNTMEQVP